MDYTSKQNSANTILNVFSFAGTNQIEKEINQQKSQQELLNEIERLQQLLKERDATQELFAFKKDCEGQLQSNNNIEM